MNKLQTTEEQPNNDELILIAHLAKEFMRDPKEVAEDWNSGAIVCLNWTGMVQRYEDLQHELDGTIEEAIAFEVDKGILVKFGSLFFMYE